MTNVIYEFKCNNENCESRNILYVGITTCFCSLRFTNYLQYGAIKEHFWQKYGMSLTRDDLVNNMNIL